MFARLTSVLLALVVMAGAVVIEELQFPSTYNMCTDVCCQKAQNTPRGWQGTDCQLAHQCVGKCPYQFCCNIYDPAYGVAAVCTQPKTQVWVSSGEI